MTIPSSVTAIGDYAFIGCTGLTSITIPSSVTSIGEGAFAYCSGLTSITIPSSVTSIGKWAFAYCTGLTSITIPSSVTTIGESAFNNCTGLTSVTIPSSVTTIGSKAFYGCTGITSVTIPSSVTAIGDGAFAGCTELTDVYCYAEMAPGTGSDVFEDSPISNSTLHVPASAIDAYRTTEPWSGFGSIVPISMPSHKLIYMVDGEELSIEEIEESATITPMEVPTKEGYTFSGWSEIPETMPNHDVTVTGTFTINQYTITFKVGDNVYETQTLDYGSVIAVPEMPELTGYTFTWSEVPETMPAGDVTIVGEYNPNYYNVTYLVDGQLFAIVEVAFGSAITTPDVPEREGSIFTWGEYPETMPAHDITIEGTYTDGVNDVRQNSYQAEFYSLDGKKMNRMQRGVNIIDGKKVVVK